MSKYNFLLGLNPILWITYFCIITINISLATVVIAAPIYENFGIKIKFKIKLNNAAIAYIFVTVTSLCADCNNMLPGLARNRRQTVKIKIDNVGTESMYSWP